MASNGNGNANGNGRGKGRGKAKGKGKGKQTQGGDDEPTPPPFYWSYEHTKLFVEVLLRHQRVVGRDQPFPWGALTPEFQELSGKKPNMYTLKNRNRDMKKYYNEWKSLKNSETGLGWDAEKGTIKASDEWWEKKIAVSALLYLLVFDNFSRLEFYITWDHIFRRIPTSGSIGRKVFSPSWRTFGINCMGELWQPGSTVLPPRWSPANGKQLPRWL